VNEDLNKRDEGKMLAIESIIRSKFGSISLQGGDEAIAILRQQEAPRVATKRSARFSTRQMPAVRAQSSTKTIFAIIMGAIIPLAAGFCVMMYLKYLETYLPGKPKIGYASEDSTVLRDSKVYSLREDMILLPKDKLITTKYGRVEIKYEDGSRVALEQGSEVTIFKKDNEKKLIGLNHGGLFAEISKQTEESHFNFYTKNALVNVIGTSFDLNTVNEKTNLKMKTGVVKITDLLTKEEHIVKGGEQLTIEPAEKPIFTEKTLDLFQMHQAGLVNLYHYTGWKKDTVLDITTNNESPINFHINKGSILKPNKGTGVIIYPETYFISKSLKPLFTKFAETNEFSIELWVKPNEETINGDDAVIFGAGKSESSLGNMNWMIYIGQSNGKIKGAIHTIGKQEKFLEILDKNQIENRSTHIVFMKTKEGFIKLFVNGQLANEAEFNNSLIGWGGIPSGNLLVGGTESGSHNWQGAFYLMALYDKALTSEEVLASFHAGY
jgi:hypothetical protein